MFSFLKKAIGFNYIGFIALILALTYGLFVKNKSKNTTIKKLKLYAVKKGFDGTQVVKATPIVENIMNFNKKYDKKQKGKYNKK